MSLAKYQSGIDFTSLNPTLHHGIKRLRFSALTKQILDYFDDLTCEITDEFVRTLKRKYTDIAFMEKYLPKNYKFDKKTSLANALHHCFPILYGLQQRSENQYQQMFKLYMRAKVTDIERKQRDKISILLGTFHLLAESKQILHLIARKADHFGISMLTEAQLTYIAKTSMQHQCNALAKALDMCRLGVSSNAKEQNVFAGLISRAKGFGGFVEKKLSGHAKEIA